MHPKNSERMAGRSGIKSQIGLEKLENDNAARRACNFWLRLHVARERTFGIIKTTKRARMAKQNVHDEAEEERF